MVATSAHVRRVALFLPSLAGGGAERVMLTLAAGFARRGLATDLVLVRAAGPYAAEIPDDVRLLDLDAPRAALSLVKLIRYLRGARPHVLFSTSTHTNVVALLAGRLASVPLRIVVRQPLELTPVRYVTPTVFLLARHLYRWADRIITSTHRAACDIAHATRLPLDRISVPPSPLVTPKLFALAREPLRDPWLRPGAAPVVLGVGRLEDQKDFSTLIRAFAEVRRHQTARLLILGEGEQRPALEALVRALGLTHDVALPGFVPNPFAYMARVAVFVLSSVAEGLPGVLVQALACGAPVIATDCPCGPREVLHNGRFGRLVPVGDAPGLARAILATLSQPKRAQPPDSWQPFRVDPAVDAHLRILEDARRA